MSKTVRIKVEYEIEFRIDPENEVVKEYRDEDELIEDLLSYHRFSDVLPVIQSRGVVIRETTIEEWIRVVN